jgi:hypothetical protein
MEHGCGDKWGLFASYIPHRVGYQCSAAYRHIIIPRVCVWQHTRAGAACSSHAHGIADVQGLLRDNHFLMTSGGEAVWAGGRGGRKSAEDD